MAPAATFTPRGSSFGHPCALPVSGQLARESPRASDASHSESSRSISRTIRPIRSRQATPALSLRTPFLSEAVRCGSLVLNAWFALGSLRHRRHAALSGRLEKFGVIQHMRACVRICAQAICPRKNMESHHRLPSVTVGAARAPRRRRLPYFDVLLSKPAPVVFRPRRRQAVLSCPLPAARIRVAVFLRVRCLRIYDNDIGGAPIDVSARCKDGEGSHGRASDPPWNRVIVHSTRRGSRPAHARNMDRPDLGRDSV